jgi:hypothetical protein
VGTRSKSLLLLFFRKEDPFLFLLISVRAAQHDGDLAALGVWTNA